MSHIADVAGLSVGHGADLEARTGVTTVLFESPAVCGVSVVGGAPGTRETDALRPGNLNPPVDAICLCGGSAFGLAAADGVQRALHALGRGFAVGAHRVPIVPAAVIFDLSGPPADYFGLGGAAVEAAIAGCDRGLGTVGAGIGATTAGLKGGLGSASQSAGPATVGALAAVNAVGMVTAADGPWFRAAPFEKDREFGGLTAPPGADFTTVRTKRGSAPGANTVIAVIATDASLTTAQAERLARSAHDGIALAVWPAHTLLDGDTVFAASTGRVTLPDTRASFVTLAAAATSTLARAIARAVYAATPLPGDKLPTYAQRYGEAP